MAKSSHGTLCPFFIAQRRNELMPVRVPLVMSQKAPHRDRQNAGTISLFEGVSSCLVCAQQYWSVNYVFCQCSLFPGDHSQVRVVVHFRNILLGDPVSAHSIPHVCYSPCWFSLFVTVWKGHAESFSCLFFNVCEYRGNAEALTVLWSPVAALQSRAAIQSPQ